MNADFFTGNRERLLQACPDGIIALSAHASLQRNADMAFAFEQEANFWYLTGIEEAGWRLIMSNENTWLVSPHRSDVAVLFDGSLSEDEARRISGVEAIISADEAELLFEKLGSVNDIVYVLGDEPHKDHYDFIVNPAHDELRKKVTKYFDEVRTCRLELAKLRAIKQPVEIDMIRRAVSLTIDTFAQVYANIASYSHEYEIEADFTAAFRRQGAQGHAYDPIVAAGKNALTLHYGANNAAISSGELVLLDIGARVGSYAADITRTYAVGEPNDRQKQVHAALEKAHHEIVALLGPGVSVLEYHDKSDEIMRTALVSLDLPHSDDKKYFPHAVSHGLGIDVHDALGRPEAFQPGMVLTVEPGIYIAEEGIGMRIEDNILITDNGYENLSAGLATSL